jgi:hypothetical protein
MKKTEQGFRSREEADAYFQAEVAHRECTMVSVKGMPEDLHGQQLEPATDPSWRIDVKDICSILLYQPSDPDGVSVKPGEYIYQFYFNRRQTTQYRGSASDILKAIDANLAHEKERVESRTSLEVLIKELGGSVQGVTRFPDDLTFQSPAFIGVRIEGNVLRANFPGDVVMLFRRPEGRYFTADFYQGGNLFSANNDWSVEDVRNVLLRLNGSK